MRHIISILLENEAGALSRVAGAGAVGAGAEAAKGGEQVCAIDEDGTTGWWLDDYIPVPIHLCIAVIDDGRALRTFRTYPDAALYRS